MVLKKEEYKKHLVLFNGVKMEIEYDDFDKLEMVLGQIKEVEEVENSRKLLKLLIDIGGQDRTILSGIKQSYKLEDLIGKKVIVLKNIKKRKMANQMSEGMVLMLEDNGNLGFLVCDNPNIDLGSRVC